jgi:hypothetical protein
MEKYVYVVTIEDEEGITIFGAYTDAVSATNTVWALAFNSLIQDIEEDCIGTRYIVINALGNKESYYVQKIPLDDQFWTR